MPIFLIVAIALGGSIGAMAQESQPTSPLYAVKTHVNDNIESAAVSARSHLAARFTNEHADSEDVSGSASSRASASVSAQNRERVHSGSGSASSDADAGLYINARADIRGDADEDAGGAGIASKARTLFSVALSK